jgi:hypothetical protein
VLASSYTNNAYKSILKKITQFFIMELGMVMFAHNPSMWDSEAGGLQV